MLKTVKLDELECGCVGCGIMFAIPEHLHQKMLTEGVKVWCPNGHHISYTNTELDRVKAQLAGQKRETDEAIRSRDVWKRTADSQRRSAVAIKGHHTRLKKRVAAGVCPCCNRTFQNVSRHMKGQHPNYTKALV